MPPKGQPSKADLAKKQKIVEDKTFGLKNKKKSKNVQRYVQNLQQAVQPKPDASKIAVKKKKEEEAAREKELNDLFKIAVSQPKVPVGVDPKSIVCEYYKVGQCMKGFKCKFSHDLNVQRKGEKIDLYSDKRDEETMEDWDQEMLEKVVETKNKEYNQNKPTDIVCKFFLEAVEKKQYGWFWVCPNGSKECQYRHALPPGYVLKSQMKALLEEETEKISVEEEIENQRAKVTTTTPLTPDLFMQWKRKKMEEKEAGLAAMRADRAKNDRMSGRELFLSDSSLFVDDDEAYEKYNREEQPESTEQMLQAQSEPKMDAQTSSASASADHAKAAVDDDVEDDDVDDDDDDDELDIDELNELEASLSRTSIQIREPGTRA
ncbi:zinc finger CCCH domain-containing protein 11-like isoform X1 [Zingiber officinale]|uniref:zinc finger CCCH domain-containing protein 11-like isoform X1 n=1 Tax=Zingiber officinale TaxID=94328 RepID=UPI001C4CA87B|nr:zinc finger CCCH domain-containing protein 11-like isoform X1 [Zingiber officinale]